MPIAVVGETPNNRIRSESSGHRHPSRHADQDSDAEAEKGSLLKSPLGSLRQDRCCDGAGAPGWERSRLSRLFSRNAGMSAS